MEKLERGVDTYTFFQSLISVFSSTNYTKSEFYLIISLIDSLGEKQNLSIEELSEISGVSTASISRFVKKLGFNNYSDFRTRLSSMAEVAYSVRKSKYGHLDALDTAPIMQNLDATKDSLDMEKIDDIIRYILSFKKCIFVGSVEDLAMFSGFRKDLFSRRIPTHLFYDRDTQMKMLESADKNCCIILPTVNNNYVRHYIPALTQAKENGAGLILFTQGGYEELDSLFDYVYTYGENPANNFGYHSLMYLSGILIKELHQIAKGDIYS